MLLKHERMHAMHELAGGPEQAYDDGESRKKAARAAG